MKKKLLLGSILLLALTACGGDKTEKTALGERDHNKVLEGNLIAEKPLDLKTHFHFSNKWHWDENNPSAKEAAEMTNVRLVNTASTTGTSSTEIFNIMMVSGNLPDIVGGNNRMPDFIKYGMEGAFIPLNDLIDEYAPDIKKFLEENPAIKAGVTAPDGNLYFIPYIQDGRVSRTYWIRQDWLDKLGLDTPTTIDELHDVMTAFRDQDPNGNGRKDEVPMLFRHWYEMIRLTTLWGARTAGTDTFVSFYKNDENQVTHGWTEPEFKEGMKHIVKWYSEGLIDSEVFTRGSKTREILFTADQGGLTRDWTASTARFNDALADTIPGFNLQPMLPPVNVNGELFEENQRALYKPDGWAITHENKYPVETVKYFNFYFKEEGRRLNNYGVEGLHYEMVDGNPKFKDEILNDSTPVNDRLKNDGSQYPIGFKMDIDYERQWSDEIALKGSDMYEENVIYPVEFIPPSLTSEEQRIYESRWPALQTYMEETVQRWVLQNRDVEAEWDNYISTLNRMGLAEVTEILQAAADRAEANTTK